MVDDLAAKELAEEDVELGATVRVAGGAYGPDAAEYGGAEEPVAQVLVARRLLLVLAVLVQQHAHPAHHRLDQVAVAARHELLGHVSQVVNARLGHPHEQRLELFGVLVQTRVHLAVQVRGEQRSPRERARLQVNHTASTHRSRLKQFTTNITINNAKINSFSR